MLVNCGHATCDEEILPNEFADYTLSVPLISEVAMVTCCLHLSCKLFCSLIGSFFFLHSRTPLKLQCGHLTIRGGTSVIQYQLTGCALGFKLNALLLMGEPWVIDCLL